MKVGQIVYEEEKENADDIYENVNNNYEPIRLL